MITELIAALKAEQLEGAAHAGEIGERIDEHIAALQSQMNDLATLKAWVLDSARVRAEAFDGLIGGKPVLVAEPERAPAASDQEKAA
jgi:hypothetical protein